MRPHDRNDSDVVLDVHYDVHANAFLQHRRHAKYIINYFVANVKFPRSFRVIVFCRLDGVALDPEQDVVDVPIVGDACIPPLELHLYNSTGITCMDLQYYPVILARRGQAFNSTSKALSEDKKGFTHNDSF